MLTALRVNNYKSFPRETEFSLRRLTLLLGKNNSGKTAVAHLPLLLFSALSGQPGQDDPLLPLRVRGLVYGSNLQELVHRETPHTVVGLGCSYTGWGRTHSEKQVLRTLDVQIQLNQTLARAESAFVSSFRATSLVEPIDWQPNQSSSDQIVYNGATSFRGLLPVLHGETGPERYRVVNDLRNYSQRELAGILHLRSIRAPLSAVYENKAAETREDSDGAEAPYLLNERSDVLDEVSAWYTKRLSLSGLSVEPGTAAFRLMSGPRSREHNIARAGQGLQQVLPIVTYLAAMKLGVLKRRLVVIEEPELHLHPSAHGGLSDLVIETLRARPALQMAIETHSENFILRIRRRVADGQLSPHDVNILWFDNSEGAGRNVREILINHDGSVTDWPSGVFSEDLDEVRAIARAGRP